MAERFEVTDGQVIRIDFPSGEGIIVKCAEGRPEIAHVGDGGEVTDMILPPTRAALDRMMRRGSKDTPEEKFLRALFPPKGKKGKQ